MKKLEEAFDRLHIPYDRYVIGQFRIYMEGVLTRNRQVNLTAVTNRDDFILKHFIDSVLCYGFREYAEAQTVVDVGTGAGFPGVPLAILSPDKDFVLIDSLDKRLSVIRALLPEAGIKNVTVIRGRAEDLAKEAALRQVFDLCVSRAVADLTVLSEYCLPFIKKRGYFLAYKGPGVENEVRKAAKAIGILGGAPAEIRALRLFGFDHTMVVIRKAEDTPAKYPRKAGIPSKRPIY